MKIKVILKNIPSISKKLRRHMNIRIFLLVFLLFALVGCGFIVDEYNPEESLSLIDIMADDVPIIDDFLFVNRQLSVFKTLSADITGSKNINFSWDIADGSDKIKLSGTMGKSVILQALEAGNARIKVTAEGSFGKFDKIIDILIGDTGSRDWIFRLYNSGLDGLTEIIEGDEHTVLFAEEKIITMKAAGTPDTGLSYTVKSSAASVSLQEVQSGYYAISGSQKSVAVITVEAVKEGVSCVKTFKVNLRENYLIEPMHWNSETDPSRMLTAGNNGSVHKIDGSSYYFRARNTVPVVNGAFKLGGEGTPILIVGGGNSTAAPNPAGANTSSTEHVPGQLDLSHNSTYLLVIDYTDVLNPSESNLLRITINNNTSAQANSVLGANCRIKHINTAADLTSGTGQGIAASTGSTAGRLVLTFNPATSYAGNDGKVSLSGAFIAIQVMPPSGGINDEYSFITITGITLEELDS